MRMATVQHSARPVELARRAGRIGYANVALYFDGARRIEGEWRFVRRYHQYLWVDLKSQLPGEIVPLSVRERGGSAVRTS